MKTIKTFEKFSQENYIQVNESWRQVKTWLKLPQILVEMLLHKLIKFVPKIGLKYDELSANIDLNKGLTPYKMDKNLKKLTLNDIKNDSLRRTLKTTGIFNTWNVYYAYTTEPDRKVNIDDNSRDVIYISKDEIKIGDMYYAERVSDSEINKEYAEKGRRRLLKSKGVEKFADLEPQMFIVAALHNTGHDKMSKERDTRYENKKRKSLEKSVDKAIKNDDILGRNTTGGVWNYDPIAYKVVAADRVDLMKKLIDGCIDKEELDNMINDLIDHEGWGGWQKNRKIEDYIGMKEYRYLPETINSIEMAKLLTPYVMKNVESNKRWINKIKNEDVKKYFQEINWEG